MKIVSNIVLREKAIFEPILEEPIMVGSKKVRFLENDLILLFNQQRLSALGDSAMLEYINSIAPSSDGLSDLRSKCSDSELLSLVKSRHIQSRSELLRWSEYLNNCLDDVSAELVKIRAERMILFHLKIIKMKLVRMFNQELCAVYPTAPIPKYATGTVATVLGIASVVVGAGSAIASAVNTNKVNNANQAINQAALDQQAQQFQETKEFNSYVGRRADAEAAGFSPYVAAGLNTSISGSSVPSQTPMQPIDMTGFSRLADQLINLPGMIQQLKGLEADTAKTSAETTGINIDNETRAFKNEADLLAMRENALKLGYDKDAAYYTQKLQATSFWSDVRNKLLNNEFLKANIERTAADSSLLAIQAATQQKQYQWIDKINQNELALKAAQIVTEGYHQRALQGQTVLAMQNALESLAREKGINLDNDTKKLLQSTWFVSLILIWLILLGKLVDLRLMLKTLMILIWKVFIMARLSLLRLVLMLLVIL